MEYEAIRYSKSTLSPLSRKGNVDLSGEHVGELVEEEGSLMRYDSSAFRPKPRDNEFFALRKRIVNQTVNTTSYARDAARVFMMSEQRRRIADRRCLACSK